MLATALRKPIIGLNLDYTPRQDNAGLLHLSAAYPTSILRAGGIPILVPPMSSREDIGAILETLDGIVFVGGADLDCQNDGYQLHPSMKTMNPLREVYDRTLMQMVFTRLMPVLGIGAGMQLLNVSQGGTLCLNIPDDKPRAISHRDLTDPNHSHTILVEPDTMMARVYGANARYHRVLENAEIRVLSMHHMAVDDVGHGFAVTARCPDGIAEAIESTSDQWLAVGVQFHPEHPSASRLDAGVFAEWIKEVRRRLTARTIRVAGVRKIGNQNTEVRHDV